MCVIVFVSSVSKLLRGLIIVIINKCQFDTFAINQAALFQFNHGCVGIQNPGTSPALLAGEPGCGILNILLSLGLQSKDPHSRRPTAAGSSPRGPHQAWGHWGTTLPSPATVDVRSIWTRKPIAKTTAQNHWLFKTWLITVHSTSKEKENRSEQHTSRKFYS